MRIMRHAYKQILMGLSITSILLGVSGFSAWAESPADFLKNMSGTWRGSGSIYISEKSKNSPLRCKITSVLDEVKKKLINEGKCATAQKKSRVTGSINYSDSDNKLTGSYFNALGDFVVTKSYGVVSGPVMTLHTTFLNEAIGKVSRVRNVVTQISDTEYRVDIFEKTKGTYEPRGSITFTK